MTDSALRRPLFLALLAYMALLAWLRADGRFAPRAAVNGRPRARLELLADGPAKEDLRGWKSEARADGLRVLVRWPAGSALEDLPLPGDFVVADGTLRPPRPARNPGDFDEAAFLADRGVAAVLEADAFEVVADAAPAAPWSVRASRAGERLRRSVHARLFSLLPEDRARLAEGLLLGYKGALPPALARAVRDAGLIHLIVPSGAKVALALLAAAGLGSGLRLSPAAAWLVMAALGAAVTLAAGGEPPYWRAYLAALALSGARALGRESDAFQALIASAWVLLLAWPRALFSEGFQMTYLALLGILSLWPLTRRLRGPAAALAISLIVQASLWPAFACDFGRASLIGAATNVIAVPAYPVLAAGGWAVWVASLVDARAAGWGAEAVSWMLGGFQSFCEKAAGLPYAAVWLSPWSGTTVAGYYAGLLALPRLKRPLGWALATAALALCAGGCIYRRLTAPPVRIVYLAVPHLAHRRRCAAIIQYNGGPTILAGEAPPALAARVERALDLSPDRSAPHLYPIRLGTVRLGSRCVPRGDPQSAIIAGLNSSAQEVATDGVEVHVGIPR